MPAEPADAPQTLAQLRKAQGLTVESLAEKAGLDARRVKAIHYEQAAPTEAAVEALARALEVEPDSLRVLLPDMQTADLATLRRSRGMTVAGIAAKLGVSERTIYRTESGERLPHDPRRWAAVLGLSEKQLAHAWRNCHPRPARRAKQG